MIAAASLTKILGFTEIPAGWQTWRISHLCWIGRGRVISAQDIFENPGTYPVYSSQTENDGEFGQLNSYDFDGDYLTWTNDGANAGTPSGSMSSL